MFGAIGTGSTIIGMFARSHSPRRRTMFCTQVSRSDGWPGESCRLAITQAASRRTAMPTGSSYIHEAGRSGTSRPKTLPVSTRRTRAGLARPTLALQQVGLARREQQRLGIGGDEGVDHRLHVLDALQQVGLAGHAVVDGDGQAAARVGVEEAVEAVGGGHPPSIRTAYPVKFGRVRWSADQGVDAVARPAVR